MEGDWIDEAVLIRKRTARQRFRREILNSWGSLCAYCGEQEATTLDHVRPRCRGGHTLESNLVAACCRCNRSKASSGWREWFETQPFFCADRAQKIEQHLGTQVA
jgi:5-methylcytosine-specific restriction endonuclease McrA